MLPYNTQLPPLRLRAYGREVQEMVERALAMTDREERTRYAHQIVQVMKMVAAKTKSGIDNEVQIWNHLARIADYRLDIDFPCEIEPHTEAVRPGRLAYPDHRLRMKNYGKLVEQLTSPHATRSSAKPLPTCAPLSLRRATDIPTNGAWCATSWWA